MNRSRKVLFSSVGTGGQWAAFTLTLLGIVSLLIGILVMPTLELTESQFYLGLLALAAFMVVSFAAGQVALIRERQG